MRSHQRTTESGRWIDELAAAIISHRILAIGLSLAIALAAAAGAPKLRPLDDYRIFFSDGNQRVVEFDRVQSTYTQTENIYFAVEPNNGDVFTVEALAAIDALTRGAWQIPFTLRVDSVTNHQHTTVNGDDLDVRDLVGEPSSLTPADLLRIRQIATAEPTLVDLLVSPSGDISGVNVTFQFDDGSTDQMLKAAEAAHALATEIQTTYPVSIYLTGVIAQTDAIIEASVRDASTLIPAMFLIIIASALLLLRSAAAVLGTLVLMITSIAAAMGFGGWIGVQITPPSASVPTIVAMLAVADSVHFLVTAQAALRRGLTRTQAVCESYRLNFQPILITSLTTAIGFLSMNFADAPPFHHLGNMAAFGVMIACFLSLTFLPAFAALVPFSKGVGGGIEQLMGRFADAVIRHQRLVLACSVILTFALVLGVPRNHMADDPVRYFQQDDPYRVAVEYTDQRLTGQYQIHYSLDSGVAGGIARPEFLREIDAFAAYLRDFEEVRHVSVITDTFKRLNQNLNEDDPAFYRLPDRQDLAAQYLLLYEMSLPFGLDVNNQIDVSKSATRIIVTLSDVTSEDIQEFAELGEAWISRSALIEPARGVGPTVLFAYIANDNIRGMIYGTALALLLISGILIFALRSVKIGVLSLVPNLVPPALAFGIWGFTVGEVNVAVSLVTGLTLGIVVDDTVHFLSKYLHARRAMGLAPQEAIRQALKTVGVAILTTSLILILGFLVLSQSSFGMNRLMAELTTIAIAAAVIADFFLLPSLLILLDKESAGGSAAVVSAAT